MLCLKTINHVSFDLDGTIIDSISAMECAWSKCCETFEINCSFNKYRELTGLPFEKILENLNITKNQECIKKLYFQTTRENLNKIEIFDGALDLVKTLSSQNLSYSIITSKPRDAATRILNNFGLCPLYLGCGDDAGFAKPHQALGLHLVNKVGSAQKNIVYVGDTITDFLFAVNCDFQYIHCKFGAHGALGANVYPSVVEINNLRELIRLFEEK